MFIVPTSASAQTVSPAETQAIAKDAYVYSYAMMESYQTWRTQAVDKTANGYVGGFNVFRHYSEPFTPDNKDIVTPNNDTPYSWAWLDLRAEPMVVSVPAVPKDRYYVMQWIDLFTQNFAYIGVRSTGFGAGNYMIAGPKWKGKKPAGIKQVFKAETDIVGTLTRTALQGPEDVPNVKAMQAQYKLQPLSAFLKQPAPPSAPAIDFPPYDKAKARTHDFIGYLNFLLQFAEPPVPSEVAIRKRFEKIGIGPGKPWDASKVDPATLAAIDAGVKEGQAEIDALAAKTFSTNGLFGSRAQLKTNYLQRDVGAMKGLYGNSLEEAWYGGYVCDGSKPSTVHFTKADLAAGKILLVHDHVYDSRPVPLRQPDQSLLDRRSHQGTAIWQGRLADDLCQQRFARQGQGKQLAAGAGGEVQSGRARLWAEQGCDDRSMETAAAGAGEMKTQR